MDGDDDGIFLFGGSSKKIARVEAEPVKEDILDQALAAKTESKLEESWKAVPKKRKSSPVITTAQAEELALSPEFIIKFSRKYAKTEADIKVKMDRIRKKSCRSKKRTRKQRALSKLMNQV